MSFSTRKHLLSFPRRYRQLFYERAIIGVNTAHNQCQSCRFGGRSLSTDTISGLSISRSLCTNSIPGLSISRSLCTDSIPGLSISRSLCTNSIPASVRRFQTHSRSFSSENSSTDHKSSIDAAEVDKFSSLSESWWNQSGEFCALHNLNELRVPLIRDGLLQNETSTPTSVLRPLAGKKILDVGCGGGILCEPLARLGANVTGLDAAAENIVMAEWHAGLDTRLAGHLQYKCSTVEDLTASESGTYDGVVASEVLEHVANQEKFIQACCSLVKPGGSLFLTTLNKTWLSYALGVIVAERVLRIVPDGAHDWDKFISPKTVEDWLTQNGFRTVLLHGLTMNPISQRWCWIRDTSVNYAIHAVKLE